MSLFLSYICLFILIGRLAGEKGDYRETMILVFWLRILKFAY